MENKNIPAFTKAAFYHPDGGYIPDQDGLTKREYILGQVLNGLCSNIHGENAGFDNGSDLVTLSLLITDKVFEQLEEKKGE